MFERREQEIKKEEEERHARIKAEEEAYEKLRLENERLKKEVVEFFIIQEEEKAKLEKAQLELKKKEEAEAKATEEEEPRPQGDLDKLKGLVRDFKLIKGKYNFESESNKAMFLQVETLINKIIQRINKRVIE